MLLLNEVVRLSKPFIFWYPKGGALSKSESWFNSFCLLLFWGFHVLVWSLLKCTNKGCHFWIIMIYGVLSQGWISMKTVHPSSIVQVYWEKPKLAIVFFFVVVVLLGGGERERVHNIDVEFIEAIIIKMV